MKPCATSATYLFGGLARGAGELLEDVFHTAVTLKWFCCGKRTTRLSWVMTSTWTDDAGFSPPCRVKSRIIDTTTNATITPSANLRFIW